MEQQDLVRQHALELKAREIQDWDGSEWTTVLVEDTTSTQLNAYLDENDLNCVTGPNITLTTEANTQANGNLRVTRTYVLAATVASREALWRMETARQMFIAAQVAASLQQATQPTQQTVPSKRIVQQPAVSPAPIDPENLGEPPPMIPKGLKVTQVKMPTTTPPLSPGPEQMP